MKINVCDICQKKGKLTETNNYLSVRNRRDLRLDYCDECKKTIPKGFKEYEKFVYELNGFGALLSEQVKNAEVVTLS